MGWWVSGVAMGGGVVETDLHGVCVASASVPGVLRWVQIWKLPAAPSISGRDRSQLLQGGDHVKRAAVEDTDTAEKDLLARWMYPAGANEQLQQHQDLLGGSKIAPLRPAITPTTTSN